jgi:predicted secreted protein
MNTALGIAAYLIIWWLVFFTLLPVGVRGQWEEGAHVPGTEPGAPVAPRLWRKALWTTLVAAAVWGALFAAFRFGWIHIDLATPS